MATTELSQKLFATAKELIPGGVNSPVRAFRNVDGEPFFVRRAKGCFIWDVDGAEMIDYFPISAITDGQGLNVTVVSYQDHLDFGLISCRELVPDLDVFEAAFRESLEELVRAAEQADRAE